MSLEIRGLSVARGKATIVRDVDLSVPAGEVTVLLGANGAGKTTLLEALSGVLPSASGEISLAGSALGAHSRVRRAKAGLGHVEQGRIVFGAMTVEENIRVGARGRDIARAFEIFPELEKRRTVAAGSLSGGEQQMVVLARALARRPKVLLVDELSLGLAPVVVRRFMPLLRALADEGLAVLLVEQFARLALSIGGRAYVMAGGCIVASGTCTEFLHDERLLHDAYLGRAEGAQARLAAPFELAP